jgi:hypothetical protein
MITVLWGYCQLRNYAGYSLDNVPKDYVEGVDTYVLLPGTCPAGTKSNGTACNPCKVLNCAACDAGSATTCAACATGYALVDGMCTIGAGSMALGLFWDAKDPPTPPHRSPLPSNAHP